MGQPLVIVFSPLGRCVSFTPFWLRSVASALSLPESWLFFLLWFCRFTVGSSGAVPRGNFWGSCEVPPSIGRGSLSRVDCSGLVASGSSELEAA